MSINLREENNIGYLELDQDDSKVNLLNVENLRKLDVLLDEVSKKSGLKALLIYSKKKDCFIAGADIKEIEQIVDPKDGASKAKAGQDVLNKLEDLKIPTICVIDGVALGGGCEFALACLYRITTFNDKVKIGLPEVNLGFVPGFGGTYRLPRIVGLPEGLKLILSGKPIDGLKAYKLGLVDKIFTQAGLDSQVKDFINAVVAGKITKKRYQRKKPKGLNAFLEGTRIGNGVIFGESRKSVLKLTKGFYPAPLKAIEVVSQNFYTSRQKGLEIEAKGFGSLAVTDISKNLVKVFYLSEKYKKLKIDGTDDVVPLKIERCGVLGAGIMGGGVAQLLSNRGIWARLKDINHDSIAKGLQAAGKLYQQAVKSRRMSKADADVCMSRISGTLDYSGFKTVDLVIEAVVENMDVKRKVFKELSEVTSPKTILATNTSALSVTEMAKQTKDPSKVIGYHFFNPVHRMPLIEIITTPMTSKETLVTMLNLTKSLGKTPIVVKDSCGFIVNRILLAYINEGGRVLEETGEMLLTDQVIERFGLPMGPFELSDEVGLDVGIKVLHILEQAFGERFKAVKIFDKILENKLLGKKTGKGLYIHGKKKTPNPEIDGLLQSVGGKRNAFNEKEVVDRMIFIMINEAARCLEEQVVSEADAIDVGMIFGTGFPPFRGGLLRYADSLGIANVVKRLEELEKKYAASRFKPCQYLLTLRDQKKNFYSS